MSAVRSSGARSAAASTSMPSMPSVPLISARPSFSARTSGAMPAAASASAAGTACPLRTRTVPSPIAASAQCASGARSPEQPSDPYSRTTGVMPALSMPRRLRPPQAHAGPPGGQRRQPQQHHRPDDLGLHLGAGPGGVRADQGALQLGAPFGRDVPGGQGAEPGRHPVVRRGVVRERVDDLAAGGDLGLGVRGELHGGAVPGDRDDVGEADRPGAHDDGVHASHVTHAGGARGAEVMLSGIRDI